MSKAKAVAGTARRSGGKPGAVTDAEPAAALPGTARNGRGDSAEVGPLNDMLGFHIRLAQDASFRAFARQSGYKHIKPGRYAAMTVIRHNPGLTQTALSKAISRDKSSVSPLVADMERRGLVRREVSPVDRRSAALHLTAAGEAMLDELDRHAHDHDERLDALAGEHRDAIIAFLKAVASL